MQREKTQFCQVNLATYNSTDQREDNSQNPLPSNAYLGFNTATKDFELFNDIGWKKIGPSEPVYQGSIVFPCDDFQGTTFLANYGHMEPDTINCFSGSMSLKGIHNTTTVTNSIILNHTFSTAINLSGENLLVRFYLHNKPQVNAVKFNLYSGATDFVTYVINSTKFVQGWNQSRLMNVPNDASTVLTGNPLSTAVTIMRLSVDTHGGSTGGHDVTFDLVAAYKDRHPAIVVICSDDGRDWNYTVAKDIMRTAGFQMSMYILPPRIDASNMLSLSQLNELHDLGWTISSHTMTHSTGFTSKSESEMRDELFESRQWILRNGFGDGAYHLAWPYGSHSELSRKVAREFYATAREVTPLTELYAPAPLEFEQTYRLPCIDLDSVVSSDFNAYIDKVISYKSHTMLLFHNKTSSDFQVNISYLRTKVNLGSLVVMTNVDYYKWLMRRFSGNWYTDQSTKIG